MWIHKNQVWFSGHGPCFWNGFPVVVFDFRAPGLFVLMGRKVKGLAFSFKEQAGVWDNGTAGHTLKGRNWGPGQGPGVLCNKRVCGR